MSMHTDTAKRNTKYHVILLLRCFLILLLLTVFMSDAIGQERRPPGRTGIARLPLRQLRLTETQRNQIRAIRQQHSDSLRNAGQQIRTTRHALEESVRSEWFDEARIRSLSTDLGNIQGEIAVLRGSIHVQTWALLTPEQQARSGEIRSEMKARRQDRQEAQRWQRDRRESRRRQR